MKKSEAIQVLGGTVAAAAKTLGVSYQAVRQWPEELPQRIEDRVVAAIYRQQAASKRRASSPTKAEA